MTDVPTPSSFGGQLQVQALQEIAKAINAINQTAASTPSLSNPVTIGQGGTGQTALPAAFDVLSPTTTRGDLIARGASSNQRLALGSNGYHVQSNGTDAIWAGFLNTSAGAATRTWNAKASDVVSVKDFGAVGNAIIVTATLSISSGQATLTATGATFTSADVGKSIAVPGAGAAGAQLTTTILVFTDATHVTLNANASTTLSGASGVLVYGTDDTTAMNSAHATGSVVLYPAANYLFTTLNAIASGGFIGQGRAATILVSIDVSSNSLVTFNNSSAAPILRDFQLRAPVASNLPVKSGGAGIQLNPVSSEISYAHLDNVTVAYCPVCFDFVAASYWTMNNCEALGYNTAGAQVANTNNTDSGDSSIQGSLFNTPGTGGVAILYKSSGGLKIVGNKMLGGNVGVGLQFNGASDTSDLLILGNSIENMNSQAISLARTSGSSHFANIVIVGNQIAVEATGIQTDANTFMSEMIIDGNGFNLSSGSGTAISLATVTDFYVGSNTIKGNGGTPTGISIASSCSNGKVGTNTYASLSTTLSNSSTTTFVQKDTQQGVATTANAGWGGYGTLFSSPTKTVSFATTFTVAPTAQDIQLVAGGTNGEIAAIVTAVSASQFSFIAVSAVTNITATFEWKAFGII